MQLHCRSQVSDWSGGAGGESKNSSGGRDWTRLPFARNRYAQAATLGADPPSAASRAIRGQVLRALPVQG